MKYCIYIFFITFISLTCTAQVTDLARVEYTYFPQRESDNSFRRIRALVNFPIKLNEEGSYLVAGLEYENVDFDYEDVTLFDVSDLDRFQSFEFSLGYTFKMKNDWRFAAKLGSLVASNFSEGDFVSDDLLFSGSIYFIKNRTKEVDSGKPWRLIIGLQYSTTAGRPFPLPFINYFKRFHPSWSYSLGVPKSNLKYFITPKHRIQAFATLDGFYANIRENKEIPEAIASQESNLAENISMTIALAGLGYEYKFTKHLLFYTYGGYTLINDIRLRNGRQEDVLTVNDENSFYVRGGIKFKI